MCIYKLFEKRTSLRKLGLLRLKFIFFVIGYDSERQYGHSGAWHKQLLGRQFKVIRQNCSAALSSASSKCRVAWINVTKWCGKHQGCGAIIHWTLSQSLCSVCRALVYTFLSKQNAYAILTWRRNYDTLVRSGTVAHWNAPYWNAQYWTCVIVECAIQKCVIVELRHTGPAWYWTCASLACAIADTSYWHAP